MDAASTAAPRSNLSSVCAGLDPLDRVHVMENHDQAYHLWKEGSFKDRVLVHIDAHHDMWWVDDQRHITIANFICPALKDDIVREVLWIVPDATFDSSAGRLALLRQVRSVAKGYRAHPRHIHVTPTSISTSLIGKKLTVCTIESLTATNERVLLDIDVDYLVIPHVAHERADRHPDTPWCWPVQLLEKIKRARLSADFATISYSVEGCYTTLAWKYLGDELAARLRWPHENGVVAGFGLLCKAAQSAQRGDLDEAERGYLEAAALLPQSAAPYYHLALLSAKRQRAVEAQRHFRKARELDPTYATGFNNIGPQYFWERRYSQAEAEFERALVLNPADGYACVGMARLAARHKRWTTAISWFKRALDSSSDEILDAHRGLGEAYARIGDVGKAVRHYERSLQLALHGHKPLSWHILTPSRPDQLLDEDHCASYAELARLYARIGQIRRAIDCYQIAFAASEVGVRPRLQLARLFARERRWDDAQRQFALAFRQVPKSARSHGRRAWRSVINSLRRWTQDLSYERSGRSLES